MPKKGREKKRRAAHKARAKAKERAAKAEKACALCGEGDRHLRRFEIRVDGKKRTDWTTCRMCTATLEVLLRDPRYRR